jgi:hypothetical protein
MHCKIWVEKPGRSLCGANKKRVVMHQKQILVTSSEQMHDLRIAVWPKPLVDLNAFLVERRKCRAPIECRHVDACILDP